MAPGRLLDRNVRPRHVEDLDESEELVASDEDLASDLEDGEEAHGSENSLVDDASDRDGSIDEDEDDGENDGGGNVQQKISNVSFGALKQAQDALSRKRKRGSDTHADHEDKLEALRARLKEIKDNKERTSSKTQKTGSTATSHLEKRSTKAGNAHHEDDDDNDSDDSDDSAPSEEGTTSRARSSKHAPTAQSSRYQVTRKRNVVDVPKRVVRDPRFDAMNSQSKSTSTSAPEKADRAYSFLLDYQKDEIAELKRAVKGTRDEGEKEKLKRTIGAMENRLKAKEAKQREQDVLRRHRKEEREKVEQGKQPFYLKRKDVKEQALVEKFKGMKSKDREKLMERRRLKESQRERRMMPRDRRTDR